MNARPCWAAALGLLVACQGVPEPTPTPAKATPTAKTETKAPPPVDEAKAKRAAKRAEREAEKKRLRTFEGQIARLDEKIANNRKIIERNPKANTGYTKTAGLLMSRARLTGSYDDYAEAEKLIDQTFTLREGIRGAHSSRMRLNYTMHRLDRVDEDFAYHLKLPGKNKAARTADLVFAANLAMQRGEYDEARTKFDEAAALLDADAVKTARAIFEWKMGHFDEADALLTKSIEGHKGKETEPVAWMHLHRGLFDLDRGRLDDAMAHYTEAKSWIDGYWLIDEHIAEVLTLQGKTDEAKTLYLDVIERTGNPEFMDAMAGILLEEGKADEAKEYVARAHKRYEEQMERFPEAAYGHALGHYLEFGEDPKYVVELAEKNHTLRPNAEAKTLLAQAYLKAGQTKKAKKIIDKAVATPYSTIDLHLTAAEVYRAAAKDDLSAKQLEKAKAIDPSAELPPLEEDKPAEG